MALVVEEPHPGKCHDDAIFVTGCLLYTSLGIPASLGQRHAQKKNAHELLSVLSAVKKGHGRGSPCLSSAVKGRAPAAVTDGGKAAEPPQEKAENHGYDKAQDDPKPGIALHVGQAAGPGGGGAGDTGHQRVALTGGDAEDPCGGGPEEMCIRDSSCIAALQTERSAKSLWNKEELLQNGTAIAICAKKTIQCEDS